MGSKKPAFQPDSLFGNVNGRLQPQQIRPCPKTANRPPAYRGNHRAAAKVLTRMNIREVNLDGRHLGRRNGISQRDAGVGISRRVEDNGIKLSLGLLDPGDQLAFGVGLPELYLRSGSGGSLPYLGFDICQARASINSRLTLA